MQMERRLQEGGVEESRAEARWLCEEVFSVSQSEWLLTRECECSETQIAAAEALLQRRLSGEPVQYILGRWPFLSLELFVGPGVLIPRPETEQLCEAAAKDLCAGDRVLDLCAGTGAVGLGICSLKTGVSADCVELYEKASDYLCRNIARYRYPVRAIRFDVFEKPDARFGLYERIVSNPPYNAESELAVLPRELSFEPQTALCGGEDGLVFYRAILENWLCLLKTGGEIWFEIGEDQGAALRNMLSERGLSDVRILKDQSGLDRIATARKED